MLNGAKKRVYERRPEQQEAFVSQTNDAQQMSVVFGDGVNGARLPTGLENVRAEYRTGLGRKGNVAGGQINQLLGAPWGSRRSITRWRPKAGRIRNRGSWLGACSASGNRYGSTGVVQDYEGLRQNLCRHR